MLLFSLPLTPRETQSNRSYHLPPLSTTSPLNSPSPPPPLFLTLQIKSQNMFRLFVLPSLGPFSHS